MGIFDLLFLVLLLIFLLSLVAALVAALVGRSAQALAILRRLAIGTVAYFAVFVSVGLIKPRRLLHVGESRCFDDWCLGVESITQNAAPPERIYTVSLRVFSRARRVSQRALGAWVCLVDSRGKRYPPEPAPSAIPLDVRLGPGESVVTFRVFKLPADIVPAGLVTGHGELPGGLPLPIIGNNL